MRIRRVLIVYKKSSFQVYAHERRDKRFLRLLKTGHQTTSRFLYGHTVHGESLEKIRRILRARKVVTRYIYRARPFSDEAYDLILTVGGDGTFLEASHSVRRKPMLGINSNPIDSVGAFCGTTADRLEETLDRIEAGRIDPIELTRLEVRVGGEIHPVPVLNDLLISHGNPAATTRYILQWRGKREEHKSSGIWVAPPAGSTAVIGAVGGRLLPLRARSFQFRVRELYPSERAHYVLRGGVLSEKEKLVVYSKMRAGKIFLDGPHMALPFPLGEKLEVSARAPRLKVLAYNEARRRRFAR